jgi:hypothetical protein
VIYGGPARVTGEVAGVAVGGAALDVTLLTSSGSRIHTLPAPMEIVIDTPIADVAPAASDDGMSWHLLAVLPDRTLHAGQNDGYWTKAVDAGKAFTYRVHILTRHVTLFALVQDSKAAAAPSAASPSAP